MATATGEAEEDEEEDWEAGTAKVAGTARWRRRHERHYYVLFSVRSVESGGRGKRILKIFQRLPKEDFKRVQLCGKERDKKEDTKRHSTRRKEHTDTVYA